MQEFLMYKRKVEKERPMLTASPRLISVDGIEGVGKTTIISLLAELLEKKYGKENVVLVKVTNLKGGSKQERLANALTSRELSEETKNRIWLTGTNRAYEEKIVPAIEAGKIVLMDRSELDLLRYAVEDGDPALIEGRKRRIADGSITHRYWPGHRVLLNGETHDIHENLSERGSLITTGLLDESDVTKRLKAEQKAEQMILGMEHCGKQTVIRVSNKRVEDPAKRARYLGELAGRIFEKIIV